ncbi:ComEA family DNA-binding protein [Herbaspirillum sp. NPDC087042]|uniref:ComEA family DNA-binding protein n=1 Tax=Herbaspirillum sp. NPDC087042 TaxID=3364004 RepID=UPI0037FB62CB
MLKKILLSIVSFLFTTSLAWAQVDINKADQAALDGVRGIGPSMSKRILAEREKGGAFKDWDDLQKRVKGVKDKSAARLSANGLTVNGQAKPGAAAGASASKAPAKAARSEGREGGKAEARPAAGK